MEKSDIILALSVTIILSIIFSALVSFFMFQQLDLKYLSKMPSSQYCVYKIPDQMKFTCGNRTVNAFGISIYQYNNVIESQCTDVSGLFNKEINSTHYEMNDCNINLPFTFDKVELTKIGS